MKKKSWIGLVVLFSIIVGVTLVQAAEPVDFTSCASGVPGNFWKTDDLGVLMVDHMGMNQSNHENKLFHNSSHRCIGIVQILPDNKVAGSGYCKYKDSDDSTAVLEWVNSGARGVGTWKFLDGAGKWKGITGSGDYKNVGRGKPIEEGTYQSCVRVTGTVEMPK